MKQLLTNREWNIKGNWYQPEAHLSSFKSVLHVELVQTSNSSGDWDGIIFQKIGNKVYTIPFNQCNNYPYEGFTLYTGEVKTSFSYNEPTFNEAIKQQIEFIYAMYV